MVFPFLRQTKGRGRERRGCCVIFISSVHSDFTDGSVDLLVLDRLKFALNALTTIVWIGVKFGADIHVPFRRNCKNFAEPC